MGTECEESTTLCLAQAIENTLPFSHGSGALPICGICVKCDPPVSLSLFACRFPPCRNLMMQTRLMRMCRLQRERQKASRLMPGLDQKRRRCHQTMPLPHQQACSSRRFSQEPQILPPRRRHTSWERRRSLHRSQRLRRLSRRQSDQSPRSQSSQW